MIFFIELFRLKFTFLVICFLIQFVSFAKRKANSTVEQQKCTGHEKHDRLLISKMEIDQVSQRNESFTY